MNALGCLMGPAEMTRAAPPKSTPLATFLGRQTLPGERRIQELRERDHFAVRNLDEIGKFGGEGLARRHQMHGCPPADGRLVAVDQQVEDGKILKCQAVDHGLKEPHDALMAFGEGRQHAELGRARDLELGILGKGLAQGLHVALDARGIEFSDEGLDLAAVRHDSSSVFAACGAHVLSSTLTANAVSRNSTSEITLPFSTSRNWATSVVPSSLASPSRTVARQRTAAWLPSTTRSRMAKSPSGRLAMLDSKRAMMAA